jgi:hypothetical protein
MDDPKPTAKTTAELQSLILKAWKRAGVRPACELCSTDRWTIVHTSDHDGLALPLRIGTSHMIPGSSYLAYALECKNCGNLRVFSKVTIERLAADVDSKAVANDSQEGKE